MRVIGATPIRFLIVKLFTWKGEKIILSLMIDLLYEFKLAVHVEPAVAFLMFYIDHFVSFES